MFLLPISSIVAAQSSAKEDDQVYKLPPLRPYRCIICHKAFLRHDHLKRHIRTHDEELDSHSLTRSAQGKKHLRTRSASSLKGPRTNQNPPSFQEKFDTRIHNPQPLSAPYIKPLEPQFPSSRYCFNRYNLDDTVSSKTPVGNCNFNITYSAFSAPSSPPLGSSSHGPPQNHLKTIFESIDPQQRILPLPLPSASRL